MRRTWHTVFGLDGIESALGCAFDVITLTGGFDFQISPVFQNSESDWSHAEKEFARIRWLVQTVLAGRLDMDHL